VHDILRLYAYLKSGFFFIVVGGEIGRSRELWVGNRRRNWDGLEWDRGRRGNERKKSVLV